VKLYNAILAVALLGLAQASTAASPTETTIRELEQAQAKAAIGRDRAALDKMFAPDFRVISPSGAINTKEELLTILTNSTTPPYQSAAYQTDIVRDYGDVVVSIGMDTVVPNTGAQAGKTVLRRVTQVWKRDNGTWRLTLRHANIVTVP
jgi:uncharacterized protein (TIGR02246 family)